MSFPFLPSDTDVKSLVGSKQPWVEFSLALLDGGDTRQHGDGILRQVVRNGDYRPGAYGIREDIPNIESTEVAKDALSSAPFS